MDKSEFWVPDPDIVKKLEDEIKASSNPSKPIVGSGRRAYSLADILEEIKTGTPSGRRYQEVLQRFREENSRPVGAD